MKISDLIADLITVQNLVGPDAPVVGEVTLESVRAKSGECEIEYSNVPDAPGPWDDECERCSDLKIDISVLKDEVRAAVHELTEAREERIWSKVGEAIERLEDAL